MSILRHNRMKNPDGYSHQGLDSVNETQIKGNATMNMVAPINATSKVASADTELPIVEYQGQRVVTLAMIDQVHCRPEGTARRNFNANKDRLIEGEDYFKVCADEVRMHKICSISAKSHEDVTLLPESGYLMLVKSFSDDLAWQVQRQLVKGYFKANTARAPMIALPNFTDPAEAAVAWAAEFKAKQLAQVQVTQLETKVTAMTADVQAFDRIAKDDGLFCITDAAKMLGIRLKDLTQYLKANDWIYKRAGNSNWLGYSDKEKSGLVDHKYYEATRPDGTIKPTARVMITPKGLQKLAKVFAAGDAA